MPEHVRISIFLSVKWNHDQRQRSGTVGGCQSSSRQQVDDAAAGLGAVRVTGGMVFSNASLSFRELREASHVARPGFDCDIFQK
jgi:hypothetical protein